MTPLIVASAGDPAARDLAIMKQLIMAGAQVNAQTKVGLASLFLLSVTADCVVVVGWSVVSGVLIAWCNF